MFLWDSWAAERSSWRKRLMELGFRIETRRDNLYRQDVVNLWIEGLVDNTHPSLPNLRYDPVLPDLFHSYIPANPDGLRTRSRTGFYSRNIV
jgi:hypothetical protein